MIELQDVKTELLVLPFTASNGGTAAGYLDRIGWDHARVTLMLGTYSSDAVSLAALSITEATNSAAAGAVIALLGTTETEVTSGTNGFVIPYGMSDVGNVIEFDIDLRKRERYLKFNITAGASAIAMSASCKLSRGRQVPGTDAGTMGTEVLA